MKNRKIHLLTLVTALVFSLGLSPVLATPSSIRYLGGNPAFEISADQQLDPTDLFATYKDLLPGDRITADIQIINASQADSVSFYLKAEPIKQLGDLTPYTLSRSPKLAEIKTFLSQLELKVWQDQGQNQANLIYDSSPDQASQLTAYVPLGDLRPGQKIRLKLELSLPLDLDNQFAGLIGEVHWLLVAEENSEQATGLLDRTLAWIKGPKMPKPDSRGPNRLPRTGQKSSLSYFSLALVLVLIGCRLWHHKSGR